MILAFVLIPLIFAVGFGLDYGRAMRMQTKLSAIADAAALVAVSPNMMMRTDAEAEAAATAYFNGQVAGLPDVTVNSLIISAPTTNSGALAGQRVVSVSFRATSRNLFSSILGSASLPIGADIRADASQPPSMNFYIALDTSPSMLLPTTSAGINAMIAGTIWKGESYWYGRTDGCAFACHANNNHQWNLGIYVVDSNNNQILINNSGSGGPFFRVACTGTVYDSSGKNIGNSAQILTSSWGSLSANYCSGYGPGSNSLILRYNPKGSWTTRDVSVSFPDTWWFARNNGLVNPGQAQITLRTDAEGAAAAGLIQYAYNFQQTYATAQMPPVYKMQFLTFNVGNPVPITTSPFGTMTAVSTLRSSTFPDLGAQAPLLCAVS